MSSGAFLVFALVVLAIYFLPTIIAARRAAKYSGAVFLLNIFLGWTLIGWVVALVWATSHPAAKGGDESAMVIDVMPGEASGGPGWPKITRGSVLKLARVAGEVPKYMIESEFGMVAAIEGETAGRIVFRESAEGPARAWVQSTYEEGGTRKIVNVLVKFGPG